MIFIQLLVDNIYKSFINKYLCADKILDIICIPIVQSGGNKIKR